MVRPRPDPAHVVGRIARLFADHGHVPYEGSRREAVTATEHALQCAQLAEWAHASPELVAAAFLHDVGHFLAADAIARSDTVDDRHEAIAVPFLAAAFGDAVVEPVRLHVEAKRFLVRVDDDYAAGLSPASVHSLALQGGPMDDEGIARFRAMPFSEDALRLRRWDDLAKTPGRPTPSIGRYLDLLESLVRRDVAAA